MACCVIGAGVAGLRVARSLREEGALRVVLLESRPETGGRVRSVYERTGEVATTRALAYESGPWRVASTHRRVHSLLRECDIPLTPAPTPPLSHRGHGGEQIRHSPERRGTGLTTWEYNALQFNDPARADAIDLLTGYAGQTHSAMGSDPYEVSSNASFSVAPLGLTALIEAMTESALAVGVDLRRNCTVTNVNLLSSEGPFAYEVHVRERTGHNSFRRRSITCASLFVCVPPSACRNWDALSTHARCVLSSVEEGDLHHVYFLDRNAPRGVHVGDPLLGQVVSSQYPQSNWFQSSYSGGRIARLWYHLSLVNPREFANRIRTRVSEVLAYESDPEAVRSYYWPIAFHKWRAVPNFDLSRAVRCCVRANPYRLPRVFFAGEALSSHQAWMEGSLETADLAVLAWKRDSSEAVEAHANSVATNLVETLTVEGRPVDVRDWKWVHPGGGDPLTNHLGEDVTELMHQVGHSDGAWATALALHYKFYDK